MVDIFYEVDMDPRLLCANRSLYYKENGMSLLQFDHLRHSLQFRKLENSVLTDMREDRYLGSVKLQSKVLPEKDFSNVGVPKYQVIAASRPLTTAKYMTHFRREMDVVDNSTKKHTKFDSGLSRDELEAFIQSQTRVGEEYNAYEIDISKYDKSQDELSFLLFAEVLQREEVPFDVVARWVRDHTNTTINFRALGLKVKAYFQRKSGDASTLHGNSRLLAIAIAWCFDGHGIAVKLLKGDDSWILKTAKSGPLTANLEGFTSLFNFETKLLEHDGACYYAGSFIILANGQIRLVPDPLKTVIKLGRTDMYCLELVSEYWLSFADDNNKAMLNSAVRMLVADACEKRCAKSVKNCRMVKQLCEFIACLVHNKKKFMELWTSDDPTVLRRKLPDPIKLRLKGRRAAPRRFSRRSCKSDD
eukprot:s2443_g8.t1